MKITHDVFEAYLQCPTKSWLRASGEPSASNTYAEWVKAQNDAYRATETERRIAESPSNEVVRSPAIENVMVAKWRLAINLVARTRNRGSCIHAVERIPSEGRGQSATFIPIRYTFSNKLTRDEKLLPAFDALVLRKCWAARSALARSFMGTTKPR